jgi:hypothetical protein
MTGGDVLGRDGLGAPYLINGPVKCLEDAQRIARSDHPSRAVVNTNGYRYAKFTERGDGTVEAVMMGHRIAEFTPRGASLWTCGFTGPTTTGALTALAPPGTPRISTEDGKVMLGGRPFPEGDLFPW